MIVVTGGTGFIGSNIVNRLINENKEVLICDLEDNLEAKSDNLYLFNQKKLILPKELLTILNSNKSKIDTVIHMGAISSTTETDIDLILQTNLYYSIELWNWCAVNNVQFIYASSAATYGDGSNGFVDQADYNLMSQFLPLNLYGWSKHLFDKHVQFKLSKQRVIPPSWVGLKFFNVYGPNENHKKKQSSVVLQIYESLLKSNSINLFRSHNTKYKDGHQLRDFIHVDDCVNVVMWLLNKKNLKGIFNVGTGKSRTFFDLATAVGLSMRKNYKINWIETPQAIRTKYQYFTEANIDKLRNAGYIKEFFSLEEGVSKYINSQLKK